jgi:ketosteroid isomerase-like protein
MHSTKLRRNNAMKSTPLDVVAGLFAAIEAKQLEAVAERYDEGIEVWHNFSNAVQSKVDNLRVLGGLIRSTDTIRYEIIERHQVTGNRVVQRHNLHCRTRAGAQVTIPACIFLTVEDGLIIRIDEYLDTAQTRPLQSEGSARERPTD